MSWKQTAYSQGVDPQMTQIAQIAQIRQLYYNDNGEERLIKADGHRYGSVGERQRPALARARPLGAWPSWPCTGWRPVLQTARRRGPIVICVHLRDLRTYSRCCRLAFVTLCFPVVVVVVAGKWWSTVGFVVHA